MLYILYDICDEERSHDDEFQNEPSSRTPIETSNDSLT